MRTVLIMGVLVTTIFAGLFASLCGCSSSRHEPNAADLQPAESLRPSDLRRLRDWIGSFPQMWRWTAVKLIGIV